MNSDPPIVEHYELLHSIGIIDRLSEQSRKIQQLEDILINASEIFTKGTTAAIVDSVKGSLDEMFVPQDLVFFIRESSGGDRISTFAYRNLKPVESRVRLDSLDPFEDFFGIYPVTLGYSLFDYKFSDTQVKQDLSVIPFELIVPIIGFNGLYGIVLFGKKMLGGDYSDTELHYIDKIMKFTSIAIQNTLHYQNSVRDLKTGLFNHSYFLTRLQEEDARSRRYNELYSVLLLDLDHFKKFNDAYGHMAGDEALIKVSGVLRESIRREDIVARFGGEEFVILLPETDRYHAWWAAERIRKSIARITLNHIDPALHLTISVGGACIDCNNRASSLELLDQADAALYSSKRRGRNRSTIHNSGLLLKGINLTENRALVI